MKGPLKVKQQARELPWSDREYKALVEHITLPAENFQIQGNNWPQVTLHSKEGKKYWDDAKKTSGIESARVKQNQ